MCWSIEEMAALTLERTKMHKLVCEVHDELLQVFHLESGECGRSDMIWRSCFDFGCYMGDIMTGDDNEYTHYLLLNPIPL
jgi:hypothetical protein